MVCCWCWAADRPPNRAGVLGVLSRARKTAFAYLGTFAAHFERTQHFFPKAPIQLLVFRSPPPAFDVVPPPLPAFDVVPPPPPPPAFGGVPPPDRRKDLPFQAAVFAAGAAVADVVLHPKQQLCR